MTIQEYNTKVWPFYLRLENEFLNTLNYVEFADDNMKTYSIEFEKILLSIGSEIDVLCKLLCKEIDSSKSPGNISKYAEILCGYENLTSECVVYETFGKTYIPFDGWTPDNSPYWWKNYNTVKHDRINNDNYKLGNLENVFMALAGLYVLNRHYCRIISLDKIMQEPEIKSKIFSIHGWKKCIPLGNGFYRVLEADGGMSLV